MLRPNLAGTCGRRRAGSREEGFTLIEILVVIVIIATLASLVAALAPTMIAKARETECSNNLKQIGGLMQALDAKGDLVQYSGAGYLLQVKDQVSDDNLKVFVCPDENENPDDPRPEVGSQAFIDMYRDLDLKTGVIEQRHSSYAGANWKMFPEKKSGRGALETRPWGADKCLNGQAHHDGIVVLYPGAKVEKIEFENLAGHDEETGAIIVGPDSPDPILQKLVYLPPR